MSGDSKAKYNVVFVLEDLVLGKALSVKEYRRSVFGFQHLSAGDLLRQERLQPNSEYGAEIERHIKEGSIVPVNITCSCIRREMEKSPQNKFLIDGFPRNRDNLDGWNQEMSRVAEVKRVLFFDCPDQVCIDRCLNRGLTSGRTDDNAESLKKRIQTYRESTLPVIKHYEALNLVSTCLQPQCVFEDVKKVFEALKC
ncbi:unnamed protein product [Candidula unifasciata]|uniref:Nucleoside-diphosphate kinase n=1 Tax=Candidula unifasciata TaxID=100452 RepID=A0A8S3Z0U1_9EUPU|nr:unnamed protein product [Candidula unifasciata]